MNFRHDRSHDADRVTSATALHIALPLFALAIGLLAATTSWAADNATQSSDESTNLRVVRSRRLDIPVLVEPADVADRNTATNAVAMDGPVPDVVARAFRIDAPAIDLRRTGTRIDRFGFRNDHFQQYFKNVRVFSGELRVLYRKSGAFRAATGRHYPIGKAFDTTPRLTAEEAAGIIIAYSAHEYHLHASELVIVDPAWYGDRPTGPQLAYRLELVSNRDSAEYGAFVNANSGQLIDWWSLTCHANDRLIYDGTGQASLPGQLVRAEGDPVTGIEDADEAYDYVGDTLAFFERAFNRNGIDDAGAALTVLVNANDIGVISCPNASYSFIRKQLVFCTGTTADDLVAHEWTHGLTANTANLLYQNQSGQLNESFSDVFGELVDLYNGGAQIANETSGTPWLQHSSGNGLDAPNTPRDQDCSFQPGLIDGLRWVIGEDATSMNGPFRDMWNPRCFQDPADANDPLQACSLIDNGGVHSGSGVPNHAFAMLCDGKTFNNITVNPIGPAKAAAVWYRALTTYLTVGSDFQDAYLAFNLAANDLVGTIPNDPRTGLPTGIAFTAADAIEVDNALRAVEMDTPGACGETDEPLEATAPQLCAQADIVFADDFESGPGAWSVSNSAPPTPYDWEIVGSLPFGRPGAAWFIEDRNVGLCGEIDESAVHDLVSPLIQTPVDFDTLTLSFDHFLETEPRYDGGIVELQVNGGIWQPIPEEAFRHNGHNISLYRVEQGSLNPIAGALAFSGAGGSWGTSVIECSHLVMPGDSIRLRFRFGKDDCYGLTGWWIDDVLVSACRSSIDCNQNAVADEIDRAAGPAKQVLLHQPINLLALANLSDVDPHPTFGPNKIAEDVSLLAPTSITGVRVRGGYDDDVATIDDFSIDVYESNAGLPGSLIASYPSIASTRQATGNIFFINTEYEYEMTLPAPLSLPAGQYLIAVYNNTPLSGGTWRWGRSWFGWTPGAAFFGQGCNWCRINTANFAMDVLGETIGRAPGDLNADGVRDFADLGAFVTTLLSGPADRDQACAADMNGDGDVDGLDIDPFTACLLTLNCGD